MLLKYIYILFLIIILYIYYDNIYYSIITKVKNIFVIHNNNLIKIYTLLQIIYIYHF